jgi:hypothetical protein
MACALGQEPVQVPHWMQALTIARMFVSGSRTLAVSPGRVAVVLAFM